MKTMDEMFEGSLCVGGEGFLIVDSQNKRKGSVALSI